LENKFKILGGASVPSRPRPGNAHVFVSCNFKIVAS